MQTVETTRLILRPFASDDLDGLAAINRDPQVIRFIGDGTPQSKEKTATRLNGYLEHGRRHAFGFWTAVEKTTRDMVGFCGLQFLENTAEVEVGYRLARRVWGMGLATEAAVASLRYGFYELKLDRIVAVVHPENVASQRVVEKIGLTYEKDAHYYGMNLKYYAIVREAYAPDGSFYLCKSSEI